MIFSRLISLRNALLLLMFFGINPISAEPRNNQDTDLVKKSLLFQCASGLKIGINNTVKKGPWVFEFTGSTTSAKIVDSFQARFEARDQKLTWLDTEKQYEILLKKDNDQEIDLNTKSFDRKIQTTTLCKLLK